MIGSVTFAFTLKRNERISALWMFSVGRLFGIFSVLVTDVCRVRPLWPSATNRH